MSLPPIMTCQHRRYLLERRGQDSLPPASTGYSVQCLFILLRIRVVCGIVRRLGIETSVGKPREIWGMIGSRRPPAKVE